MTAPAAILWTVIAALFAIWVAGLILQFMVGWIWLVFALAVVLLFVNLLPRRRAAM
jgi:hypothetical protein